MLQACMHHQGVPVPSTPPSSARKNNKSSPPLSIHQTRTAYLCDAASDRVPHSELLLGAPHLATDCRQQQQQYGSSVTASGRAAGEERERQLSTRPACLSAAAECLIAKQVHS